MSKKSKEEQEAMDKWWEEHTSDPKVVEEMFKNSAKSEADIPGGCLRGDEQGYQGDGTEWIYEKDEDGKITRRKMGSDKKERLN